VFILAVFAVKHSRWSVRTRQPDRDSAPLTCLAFHDRPTIVEVLGQFFELPYPNPLTRRPSSV
jgi:hypothetical protein